MKVFAISRRLPGADQSLIDSLKTDEALRAWQLFCDDIVREMYWRKDGEIGIVLVMECVSVHDAKHTLSSLPMVIAGQLDFDLIPVGPCDHFSRLFADQFKEAIS